jgi:enediyne biosynthesis protein E4
MSSLTKNNPRRQDGGWTRRKRYLRFGLQAPLLALLLATCTPEEQPSPTPVSIHFTEIGQQAGLTLKNVCGTADKRYIVEAKGGSLAAFDYDRDGDMDLYIVNGSTLAGFPPESAPRNALYQNAGDATFSDVAAAAGTDDERWGMGAVAADYDNDGDPDLYVTNFGGNRLYQNAGDGTFSDYAPDAGVADERWSTGAAWGDYDNDGDVDLYVANYIDFDIDFIPKGADAGMWRGLEVMFGPRGLIGAADALYRNQGDGTFADGTVESGVTDHYKRYGFAPLFSDLDRDGDQDIFVANDAGPNMLYRNQGDGTFKEAAVEAAVAFLESGDSQACMGAASADYDNDGDFDLYVTNFALDYNTLYQNDGQGFFADVTANAGLVYPTWSLVGWGTGFADFDNDGWQDLFAANGHVYPQVEQLERGSSYGQTNQLFSNQGDGTFKDASAEAGPGFAIAKSSRGSAFADFDNDGDIDIAVHNLDSTPSLLRNDSATDHHWLIVRTEGVESNRDGIGALVRIETDTGTQLREIRAGSSFLAQDDIRAHFGLGQTSIVKRIEVRWPSGRVDSIHEIVADRIIAIREGQGLLP